MNQKHIVHVFHGFRVGGSEVRTCQIINGLGDGCRHTIVALNGDFAAAALIERPDTVTLLHAPGFAERSFLANVAVSRRWLKRLRPDLLIAYSWGGFEWLVGNSYLKICPDIFSIEGFLTDEAISEVPHRRLVRRLFAGKCVRLHACSLKLQELAVKSWGVKRAYVAYIPNGIDVGRFQPLERPHRSPPIVAGIVASLSSVKNHRLLLEAFSRLPPDAVELRIAGDGPERESILTYLSERNLTNVQVLGHLTDPSRLLNELDIFCLSSKSEQMPIAVLEAMATGLPIVSTDVGDVQQMVSEANRPFIVPPGDTDAYVVAVKTLAADAALRAKIGEQNRQRCCEEFGFALMLKRHRALYELCMT